MYDAQRGGWGMGKPNMSLENASFGSFILSDESTIINKNPMVIKVTPVYLSRFVFI